jgi:uncharacterized delta-60 repeat protein
MALIVRPVAGQSALDGFDPNANGAINVVVVQPADGKILIGGSFTTLAPNGGATVTRNHIARLNPDGTLDAAFNPNANATVRSIAIQTDGKILIGGTFFSLSPNGGPAVPRNSIARLNPDGTLDTFNPNANNPSGNADVYSIVLQTDHKILLGGTFTTLMPGAVPVTRNRIARMNENGSLDTTFNPNANGDVYTIALQRNGKVLLGGQFTTLSPNGGATVTRNRVARVNQDGTLDTSFNPNANNFVFSIAVQADGKVLLGGQFTTLSPNGGAAVTRNRIARVNQDGTLDTPFNPNANSFVFSIAVQTDGKILAGGQFTNVVGMARNFIARLNQVGTLDTGFSPFANGSVNSIAVQPDNKILVGGLFGSFGGQARNRIARLEIDGRLDQTLFISVQHSNPDLETVVFATAVQPDGKILIGGGFSSAGGIPRPNLARLNSDGTLDTAYEPGIACCNDFVRSIAVQDDGKILVGSFQNLLRLDGVTGMADGWNAHPSDPVVSPDVHAIAVEPGFFNFPNFVPGKILAGGQFTSIGGATRRGIARLDATSALAESFDAHANGAVLPVAVVKAFGITEILAGGSFSGSNSIGGQSRNHIARLTTAGSADSFNPNADGLVTAVAVQPDVSAAEELGGTVSGNKVLVGGEFQNIGGQTHHRVGRLSDTGMHEAGFDGFDATPNTLGVQGDGKILVGGGFSGTVGHPANIARLEATTGTVDSFDANMPGGLGSEVASIALQADGKILVGGFFHGTNSIGGQSRDYFARLRNDTAALQNLAVTGTTITWTLGGSSPQFTRVTFEYSTDNENYTLLGNGDASGGSWTVTGLGFPTNQNIYIRARGHYRSGSNNGSESIMESVRNAFITLPPTPLQVVSRKLHNGTPFDINLPLTGNAGIECRSGGAANDYQIVLTFPSAVTFTNASVTAGTGSVSSSGGSGTTAITVNLTGVANEQTIMVTFSGLSDGTTTGDLNVPMAILIADTNGDRTVNSSDVSQTKGRVGQTANATNFRSDVNTSAGINASDISLVKVRVGTGLP